ncbi:MAG TPA: hydrogenase expression/formation C-terminal domain-containing protein [Caldimonas sp.]
MRAVTIPIRSLIAEPEESIEYMPMPREMMTFEMPCLPEPGADNDVAGARDVLETFLGHFDTWLEGGAELPALDLKGLAADSLRVLNETLGEGEVSAIVDAGHEIRIQETVFSGVWREQHFDARGALLHDYLLAAPIPPVVTALARERAAAQLRALELPAGAMNVPALIYELQEAMDRSGPVTPAHVINLTLLPLSPEDTGHIDRVLDGGSVVILSRGFGNCRISSTAARNVWRVQYFNNMQTLILNTIEVIEMPEVAVAAREDLVETRTRLADLTQWMGDSIAAA